MKITRKYHFYAAHRNLQAGDKCGRIHGHTYEVVCTFVWKDLEQDVAMLFSELDAVVEPIVKSFDHYFLLHEKDVLTPWLIAMKEPFISLPFETSAENMARHLFELIEPHLPIAELALAETKSGAVIYTPHE